MKKQQVVVAVIFVLCGLLLIKDAVHLSIPVAFILCLMALRKRAQKMFLDQWHGYQKTIQKEFDDAEKSLANAQDFLKNAEKNQENLEKSIHAILQSAHQGAAFLLKQAENDIIFMEESQRRQLEIQKTVLRQKSRAVMGQELISAIGGYVLTHAEMLPNFKKVVSVVSNKVNGATRAAPMIKERAHPTL